MSHDVEVKSVVLYQIMELAIYYNRWYAMGTVKKLFGDLKDNIAVQNDLAIRLREEPLRVFNIFESVEQLPLLIRNVVENEQ